VPTALAVAAAEDPAVPPPPAPAALRLELKMDQTELADGRPWTGRLQAVNAGAAPVRFYPRGRLDIELTRADGKPAKRYLFMGAGEEDAAAELRSVRTIAPGESVDIAVFDRSEPFSALGGRGGGVQFGWRLTEGEYRLRVRYTVDEERLKAIGAPDAWTGALESETASVRVREPKIATPAVQGLQVSLEGDGNTLGLRFRNDSDAPIVVDVGGFPPMTPGPMRARVVVRDAEGQPVSGYLQPTSFPGDPRKGQFVRIAPGESHWLCKYSPAFIPSLINGAGMPMGRLPPGRYTLRAVYECDRDESADVGAEGPALVVRVESADVPVVVPERRAPRSSPSPSPKAEPPSLPAVEKKQ